MTSLTHYVEELQRRPITSKDNLCSGEKNSLPGLNPGPITYPFV
jgi:hypothetical protein